jgi:hypothetical protein
MTPDFAMILTATAAAAYGAWAVGSCRDVKVVWRGLAMLCVALSGINVIALIVLSGDGRVIPGWQLHPLVVQGGMSTVYHPLWSVFLPISAQLLVWLPRPQKTSFVLPLPATLCFLVVVLIVENRSNQEHPLTTILGEGPHADAFLTLVPDGEDVRLVITHGRRDETLVDVLHVHEAEGWPGDPRVAWTADGRVIVVSFHRQRIFALTLDGETTGWLPTNASDWPRATHKAESAGAIIRHSEARMNVDRLVQRHGRMYVPPSGD